VVADIEELFGRHEALSEQHWGRLGVERLLVSNNHIRVFVEVLQAGSPINSLTVTGTLKSTTIASLGPKSSFASSVPWSTRSQTLFRWKLAEGVVSFFKFDRTVL
jgi:hypothetical protein